MCVSPLDIRLAHVLYACAVVGIIRVARVCVCVKCDHLLPVPFKFVCAFERYILTNEMYPSNQI